MAKVLKLKPDSEDQIKILKFIFKNKVVTRHRIRSELHIGYPKTEDTIALFKELNIIDYNLDESLVRPKMNIILTKLGENVVGNIGSESKTKKDEKINRIEEPIPYITKYHKHIENAFEDLYNMFEEAHVVEIIDNVTFKEFNKWQIMFSDVETLGAKIRALEKVIELMEKHKKDFKNFKDFLQIKEILIASVLESEKSV